MKNSCLLLLLLLQEPQLLEVGTVEQLVVRSRGGAAEVLGGARVLVLSLPGNVAAKVEFKRFFIHRNWPNPSLLARIDFRCIQY